MVPRETGGTFSGHGNQIRYKSVPQVHIRYRAKKYLAETKFRMADRITLWRIVLRGLGGSVVEAIEIITVISHTHT